MAHRTQYELEILLGARKASSYDRNLAQVTQGFRGISSTAKKAAAVIGSSFAAVQVGDAIKDSVQEYNDYEQEITNTAAIANANAAEQERLSAAARQAGRMTTKTAQESAAALGYMSLAGWNTNESIASLMPVLQLSESTNLDLARTSDLVTDSMSAMKLGVSDLPEYLDLVVASNNNANNTSEQAMESFIRTGGAAKALGVTLEETAVASGILANNGTKGAEAGRSLNAMFTRISANDSATKALKKLGVSIFDANGEFVGLEKSLTLINEKMAALSTEQKSAYLKDIAGTQYASKMEYLLDSVRKGAKGGATGWDKLEDALEDSEGALERMDQRITGTTKGSIARMDSALSDLKISTGDALNDGLVVVFDRFAEILNDLSEDVGEFASEHENEIVAFFESVADGAENLVDAGGNMIRFVSENRAQLEGLAGSAISVVAAFKAMRGVLAVKNLFGAMSKPIEDLQKLGRGATAAQSGALLLKTGLGALATPAGAAVVGIGAAAAAIGGLAVYSHEAHKKMVAAGLEEHFGQMNLSLDQLDSVAQDIVGRRDLTKIAAMLDAVGEKEAAVSAMSDSLEKVQTIRWKMKAGFSVDREDTDVYVDSVRSYVDSAQKAVEQEGYSVSVSTRLLMGADSSLERGNNAFYAGLQGQMDTLEKRLNKKLQRAIDKGVDISTDKSIQKLLAKMAKITDSITESKDKASLAAMKLKYSGKDLTYSDFTQLSKDISKKEEEAQEGYLEAYQTDVEALENRLDEGDITQKQFNKMDNALQKSYRKKVQKMYVRDNKFYMQTVADAYGVDLEDVRGKLGEAHGKLQKDMDQGVDPGNLPDVMKKYTSDLPVRDKQKRDELAKLMTDAGWQSRVSAMQGLGQQVVNSGAEVSDNFRQSMMDVKGVMAMGGLDEYGVSALADSFEDDEVYSTIIRTGEMYGKGFSEEVAAGLHAATPEIEAALDRIGQTCQSHGRFNVSVNAEAIQGYLSAPSGSVILPAAESAVAGGGAVRSLGGGSGGAGSSFGGGSGSRQNFSSGSKKPEKVHHYARGGISYRPILTTFSEDGPEAAIPLDGSDRAKSLWMESGQMLGMLGGEMSGPGGGTFRAENRLDSFSSVMAAGDGGHSAGRPGDARMSISYAPVIRIEGNADRQTVTQALDLSLDRFAELMAAYKREQGRVSF